MNKKLVCILSGVTGFGVGIALAMKLVKEFHEYADKHLEMFKTANQWIKVKQKGGAVEKYLINAGYQKIAIYGMGYLGETLVEDLSAGEIIVCYGIDKKAEYIFSEVDVYTLDDRLPEVDAVIVTSVYYFEEIKETLSGRMKCPILSLEDILYEM